MIIGIDIDNTLTEIQEELNKAAYEYAIKPGKDIPYMLSKNWNEIYKYIAEME